MKCQILFSGKNKKNINLTSAENAQRVVKVNALIMECFTWHNELSYYSRTLLFSILYLTIPLLSCLPKIFGHYISSVFILISEQVHFTSHLFV